jgi:hypothetical protein
MQELLIIQLCCQEGTKPIQDWTSSKYIDFITILSVLNSKTRVKMPLTSDPWLICVALDVPPHRLEVRF